MPHRSSSVGCMLSDRATAPARSSHTLANSVRVEAILQYGHATERSSDIQLLPRPHARNATLGPGIIGQRLEPPWNADAGGLAPAPRGERPREALASRARVSLSPLRPEQNPGGRELLQAEVQRPAPAPKVWFLNQNRLALGTEARAFSIKEPLSRRGLDQHQP